MQRLFLDTEFNGFGGQLLSVALVPEYDNKKTFYQELKVIEDLHPWVKENVMPNMRMAPCSYEYYQSQLANYLWEIGDCQIIADWPDDIRYICQSFITGPGMCLKLMHNIGFYLDFGIEYESKLPHNALYDAIAIREHYIKMGK
jgi:hypothetical protein